MVNKGSLNMMLSIARREIAPRITPQVGPGVLPRLLPERLRYGYRAGTPQPLDVLQRSLKSHGHYTCHMAMAWRSGYTYTVDIHQRPRSTVRGARTQWASPGALNTAASGIRGSDGQGAREATDACSSSPARARGCAPWQSQAARKALRRRPRSRCTQG